LCLYFYHFFQTDADDPQGSSMGNETGASVDVTALLSAGSVAESGSLGYRFHLKMQLPCPFSPTVS